MNQDNNTRQLSPGMRIKMLRVLLGYSRESFAMRHGLNINTLTSIELDRLKVSPRQLKTIIAAFRSAGLQVTSSWISDSNGPTPTHFLVHFQESGFSYLEQWAKKFVQYSDSVITTVRNSSMEPFYFKGDLVGGRWKNSWMDSLYHPCIIQEESKTFVGILQKKDSHEDCDELILVSPKGSVEHTLQKKNSMLVARILWHVDRESHQIGAVASAM